MRRLFVIAILLLLVQPIAANGSWLCFSAANGEPAYDGGVGGGNIDGCTRAHRADAGDRKDRPFDYWDCTTGDSPSVVWTYRMPMGFPEAAAQGFTANSFVDWFTDDGTPDGLNVCWEVTAFVIVDGQEYGLERGIPASVTTPATTIPGSPWYMQRTTIGSVLDPFDNAVSPAACDPSGGNDCRAGELVVRVESVDDCPAVADTASNIDLLGVCLEYTD